MRTRRTSAIAAAVLTAVALTLSACTQEAPPKDSAANASAPNSVRLNTSAQQNRVRASKVDAIANLVPPDVRAKSKLVVAVDGTGSPPLTFRADDNRTEIGVEPDIAQLVADVLGLQLDLEPTSWENIFLGIDSGQYGVGFSNITVTEERKQKYDFATYRTDTIAFEAKKDSPITSVQGPKDIAGKTIAVTSGTNQEKILLHWDAENRAAGLAPVKLQYYQNSSDYYLALRSGRIDLYVGPNPSLTYHVATANETKIVGTVSGGETVPAQIAAMTKKDNGLVEALNKALNNEIANGQYAQVLGRWHLDNEGLKTSEVNPPGLPKS
jgi:polar amino acid transport system substrate-binding protein